MIDPATLLIAVPSRRGFTLVEMLVGTAVLSVLIVLLVSVTDFAGRSYRSAAAKIEQFSEARRGFETMTRRLAEATLNTYWDYFDAFGKPAPTDAAKRATFIPHHYGRNSELRFRSGLMSNIFTENRLRSTHGVFFQAPAGEVDDVERLGVLDQTLSTWGYFLEIDDDRNLIPEFLRAQIPPRRRSRLLELREPTERLSIYVNPNAPNPAPVAPNRAAFWWFSNSVMTAKDRPVRVLAENVIALVILPRLSANDELARKRAGKAMLASKSYDYDSTLANKPADAEINPKNQLPPVVQVIMIAIDEISAARIAEANPKGSDFGLKLSRFFKEPLLLEDNPATPEPGDGDLGALEKELIEARITYRIFNTNVAIRGAKWSRSQTD